ncbi:MAG: nucleotidyltransferase domain-containing protein [Deltaproteobacteria bacterium]|nr:nucleotidyltransferase domain-containing protein [Deltaproteobacteria bacterium]
MTVTPADLRATLLARARQKRAGEEARRRVLVEGAERAAADLAGTGRIVRAWLIGSAAWGGFGERSDVDVVVRGLDVAHRVAAEDLFGAACHGPVDLLRFEDLDAAFQARVEREGRRIA